MALVVPPRVPARHVYVHVPFCARRCSYCDFAIAVRRVVPVNEYVDALRKELAVRFGEPAHAGLEPLDTLYLGGGTPSRLGGAGVAAALDAVRDWFPLAPDAEVTIEANPDDVSADAARAWRDAGVNRVSLGSQSFDRDVLRWMHRTHDVEQVGRAVDALRGAGIGNLSLDLIFAVPTALERDWDRDLAHALALAPDHLSLYGLTIEPGTPLGRWHERGTVAEADEDRYADEFLRAHETMGAAGFEHYEVSNFGRPGRRSRHNSSYWRGVPYVGLGPAAHGFDGGVRRWNAAAYAEWVRQLETGCDPVAGQEQLQPADRAAESVYLGLRTTDGLVLEPGEAARVAPWIDQGWATLDGARLRLTAAGWLRLDALAADLTVLRSR
ncbi:oxygen-independent coproporphyrinogen III oxidase [Gemmatirosa kalamazoonensis]|uniref:Heme chaperone HemW n=1 Tax=Gemmatirosa kalamazoonensis TaxID=861299 RepID=W0RKP0_9BACT|nr:radical SAM family heme chaperone HemW [Gemmatirosa kalamazoonensis]AHG91007.1 oxygen-independent coproporphyrinogen III oxidase [Gemmatirosa kalamazoonensis]